MIFIVDLYKLPPVITPKEKESLREFYKTPYFLMLKFFKKSEFHFIEFDKVYC